MFNALMSLENIKHQILSLPEGEMRQLLEWLSFYLEDQAELNPDFVASIERGMAQLRDIDR